MTPTNGPLGIYRPQITRSAIYDNFLLATVILALYGVGQLIWPFAGSVLGALLCAMTFYPMYQAFQRWMPKLNRTLCAGLASTVVFIFVVGPILLLMWALVEESTTLIPVLKQGSTALSQWRDGTVIEASPWMDQARFFMSHAFGVKRAQFQDTLVHGVDSMLAYVSLVGSGLAKHLIGSIFDLLILIFVLFFMFRDGEKLSNKLLSLVPLRQPHKTQITSRFHDAVIGIARGLLLTSLLQGLLATVGFFIVGVDGAVLLGALTSAAGFIPVVGTAIMWVPVGIFFLMKGSLVKGIFIMIWGGGVVAGLVDVVVRPYLMSRKAELSVLPLFFALVGGLEVWGPKGIILGPLVMAIAPILFDIYRQRYLRQADKEWSESPNVVTTAE